MAGGVLDRIGVVGGGTMGSGIAEVCARAECDVIVFEVSDEAVLQARHRLGTSLRRAVKAGRLDESTAENALQAVRIEVGLECLGDRQLVIEAAPEDEVLKLDLFRRLDGVLMDGAVLASNTSSIPLVKMAAVTHRPESVVGVHFFNSVPILPLVEIVESLLTSSTTLMTATSFVEERLGKQTIRSKD